MRDSIWQPTKIILGVRGSMPKVSIRYQSKSSNIQIEGHENTSGHLAGRITFLHHTTQMGPSTEVQARL